MKVFKDVFTGMLPAPRRWWGPVGMAFFGACLAGCAAAVGGPSQMVALRLLHWARWEAVSDTLGVFCQFRAVVLWGVAAHSLPRTVACLPRCPRSDSLPAAYRLFPVASC